MIIVVCKNENGHACNVFGSIENCGITAENVCGVNKETQKQNGCRFGYVGEKCEFCDSGFYTSSGENGIISQDSNKGVLCQGNFFPISFLST